MSSFTSSAIALEYGPTLEARPVALTRSAIVEGLVLLALVSVGAVRCLPNLQTSAFKRYLIRRETT
jgi:hypothetical protein